MNTLLLSLALALAGFVVFMVPSEGGSALLLVLPLVGITAFMVYRFGEDRKFLLQLLIAGLLCRVLVGTCIYIFRLQDFFGGDALTYDYFGNALSMLWSGHPEYTRAVEMFTGNKTGSGWGMLYYVAVIYRIVGQNMLATQYVNSLMGAASALIAYMISIEIFPSRRVARLCAMLVAFFPSLVLWSSQGLKDGPIIFVLTLAMLATLKLGDRFSIKYVSALAFALMALLSLRFYVFYIAVIAVVAAFFLGRRQLTAQSFARQLIVITVVSLALAYFGVSRYASQSIEVYGTGDMLQRMRLDASRSAQSGFAEDVDVSTASGALSTLPLGMTYLLLAPFPWQLASFRQAITLPEMLIWWTSLPFLVVGAWFTLKHKLRQVAPIVIFTILLTLTYSILQGNVGTAYRQRAQLLVFYFVFIAIGVVLVRERREAKRAAEMAEAQRTSRPKWGPSTDQGQMPVAG